MPYQINRATYAVSPYFLWQTPRTEPTYRHKIMRDFFVSVELVAFEKARTLSGFLTGIRTRLLLLILFYVGPVGAVSIVMLPRVFRDRRVRLLVGAAGLFFIGILLNAFVAVHYMAPATCLVFALLLQSLRHMRFCRPGGQPVGLFLVRAVPVACLLSCLLQPIVTPVMAQRGLPRAAMKRSLETVPGRHLVFVRYSPQHDPYNVEAPDWVYNNADIDASRVVWARDMGPQENVRLIDFFKDRKVWLVEPDTNPVRVGPYTP